MYRMETQFLPCTHLPQRLKPQTDGQGAAFYFFRTVPVLGAVEKHKNILAVQLQYINIPFLQYFIVRAKNLIKIGLLAPFYCGLFSQY